MLQRIDDVEEVLNESPFQARLRSLSPVSPAGGENRR
jgi:hypothetical protein